MFSDEKSIQFFLNKHPPIFFPHSAVTQNTTVSIPCSLLLNHFTNTHILTLTHFSDAAKSHPSFPPIV